MASFITTCNLAELLQRSAAEPPGREAIVFGRHRIAYRELDGLANQCARVLAEADRWRPLLARMQRAEQLGLDLPTALQTARQLETPSHPLLARVEAGLAAWTTDHETRHAREQWTKYEPRVAPEQGPQPE
ncbi:hypothetical protein [Phycicoccus sp. Soil803]|uniref:hypothetical protein n=1 Tax=Phycicoccus sp. Soil803 TaxID=1736415 RepID=UPI0007099CBE|nr:hypothetical protein [Phycicoccus sp. Soil803]KRF21803.1 hypothetical protein ASG95_20425 [Phycicoccus sp. Soil803]